MKKFIIDKKMFFDKIKILVLWKMIQENKIKYHDIECPVENPNLVLIERYPLNQICEEAKFFDDGAENNDVV